MSYVLAYLGVGALARGEHAAAAAYLTESLALFRQVGDHSMAALPLHLLGFAALRERDLPRAAALVAESLRLNIETGEDRALAACLAALGALALTAGQHDRAGKLCGATVAVLERAGAARLSQADQPEWERTVAGARAALGGKAFATAYAQGGALSRDAAVALALATAAAANTRPVGTPALDAVADRDVSALSAREREVLRLVAASKSNPGIQAQRAESHRGRDLR